MIASETELSYFIQLFQIRHFTKTAEKLRITQSALTQSISKLEKKVGSPLFYRSKKGCHPTAAGETLFQQSRDLVEKWNQLTEKIQHDQKTLKGNFKLGCHPNLATRFLPKLLKNLSKTAPHIEIDLSHDYSANLVSKVISYELDFCFAVNPIKHKDLVLRKIDDDRICIWKSKGTLSPIQKIFTDMSPTEVRTLFGKKFKPYADWQIVETTSLELIQRLTMEGVGIGILPEKVAQPKESALELVDAALPVVHDEIYLVYRYDTMKSEAAKQVIEMAKKI